MTEPRPQNPRRIGLRLPVPGPLEAERGVLGGCPIRALDGALDYTPAREPGLGTALRRRPIGDLRALFLSSLLNSRDTRGQHLQRLSGAEQLLIDSARSCPIPRKNMI